MKALGILAIICAGTAMANSQQTEGGSLSSSNRGTWLYGACLAEIRVLDSPNEASPEDGRNGTVCLAYIHGFADGLGAAPEDSICLGDARIGTLVRVYTRYMADNPSLLDSHKSLGLGLALTATYPCPITKKPKK